MEMPAARILDMHVCPMITVLVPHVGGPVIAPCCWTVFIGMLPAARVTDMCICIGPPDMIAMGSTNVLIGGLPAARMLDPTIHGGLIMLGDFTVLIGDTPPGGGGGGGMAGFSAPTIDIDIPGLPEIEIDLPSLEAWLTPPSLPAVADAIESLVEGGKADLMSAVNAAENAANYGFDVAKAVAAKAMDFAEDPLGTLESATDQAQQALQDAKAAANDAVDQAKGEARALADDAQAAADQAKQAADAVKQEAAAQIASAEAATKAEIDKVEQMGADELGDLLAGDPTGLGSAAEDYARQKADAEKNRLEDAAQKKADAAENQAMGAADAAEAEGTKAASNAAKAGEAKATSVADGVQKKLNNTPVPKA